MTTIPIDTTDLLLAASLVLINGGLSLFLQLGLTGQIVAAALRMVVQLVLVGWVLAALFTSGSPWATAAVALAMVLFAGREILARQDRRLKGWWSYGLGTVCMLLASTLVTLYALGTQLRPEPWYDPRYSLPLMGMVLGNTMTGISLGLHGLTTGLSREKLAVEAQLALGATRFEAARPVIRSALRSGLMPIINSMAAAGIVSIPGMMTGQILAGADPILAARYQMLILFLIAGGTALGSVSAVFGGVWRLTDERHRLRLDRLS